MKILTPLLTVAALTLAAGFAAAEEVQVPEFKIVNVMCVTDPVRSVKARCGAVDHRIEINQNLIAANPEILEYAVVDEDGTLWLPEWHIIALEQV